jgi:hypothetical protein
MGLRSFGLVVLLLTAACYRTDPLYCESSLDCVDQPDRPFCDVEGSYPGSYGIGHTCIADPGGPDAGVMEPDADLTPDATPL